MLTLNMLTRYFSRCSGAQHLGDTCVQLGSYLSGGRAGHPLIGGSVVWSLVPPEHMLKYPWAQYWTPKLQHWYVYVCQSAVYTDQVLSEWVNVAYSVSINETEKYIWCCLSRNPYFQSYSFIFIITRQKVYGLLKDILLRPK